VSIVLNPAMLTANKSISHYVVSGLSLKAIEYG